jgi:hypothetical protein
VEGDGRFDDCERRQYKPEHPTSKKKDHEQHAEDQSHNRVQDEPRLVTSPSSRHSHTSSRPRTLCGVIEERDAVVNDSDSSCGEPNRKAGGQQADAQTDRKGFAENLGSEDGALEEADTCF